MSLNVFQQLVCIEPTERCVKEARVTVTCFDIAKGSVYIRLTLMLIKDRINGTGKVPVNGGRSTDIEWQFQSLHSTHHQWGIYYQ